jgi:hypothetical protein
VSRGVQRQLELGTRGGEWRGGGVLGHGVARDKNAACTWDSRWWAVTGSADMRWHAVTVATMASPHMRGCALAGTRGHGPVASRPCHLNFSLNFKISTKFLIQIGDLPDAQNSPNFANRQFET